MRQQLPKLEDTAILELTKNGQRELREPGTTLAPEQLQALVLVDGHSNVAQVIERTRSVAPDVMRARLSELAGKGLVNARSAQLGEILDPGNFFTLKPAPADAAEGGEQAHAEADANTEFLQRNGYCVNMARRPAVKRERTGQGKPMVLVIDDDPDICKLLQMFLKLENIDSRTAANREEIVAALRMVPLPDLVLLDVNLTDVNGFDVLARMRQHPSLKSLPVIMLTAEATRAAVLKGILGGADGYITKPFQIHPLVKAIKTVLGLKFDPND